MTRTHPFLDRYRGDGEVATRDVYDAATVPRGDLPATRVRDRRAPRRARAASVVPPRPRRTARRDRGDAARCPGRRRLRRRVTGNRRHRSRGRVLLGAIAGLDAAGTVAVIATGGGRTTGIALVADLAVPGAATLPHLLAPGERDDVPRGAAGPNRAGRRGRERPDGRSARERDVRARGHRDAQPARRTLRRMRHPQHAAVHPPDVPVVRGHQVRHRPSRSSGCRPHLRGEPHHARRSSPRSASR